MSFWTKYKQATRLHNSYVCVGLDTVYEKMPKIMQKEKEPIWRFNKEIIDATKNKTAAYKLNYAFYMANGIEGLRALEKTIRYIPSYVLKILDIKIGDIFNTMEMYGQACFDVLNVEAVTVNPLMGNDVFEPLLKYKNKMLFILTLTSNPSSKDFLQKNDLYKDIANEINHKDYKQVGAVVGATNAGELKIMRKLMPHNIFLIPGIGAQGGSLVETVTNAAANKEDPRFLINSSRGIIYAGKDENFANDAVNAVEDLRKDINYYLEL